MIDHKAHAKKIADQAIKNNTLPPEISDAIDGALRTELVARGVDKDVACNPDKVEIKVQMTNTGKQYTAGTGFRVSIKLTEDNTAEEKNHFHTAVSSIAHYYNGDIAGGKCTCGDFVNGEAAHMGFEASNLQNLCAEVYKMLSSPEVRNEFDNAMRNAGAYNERTTRSV